MGFLPHHSPSLCSSRHSVYLVRGLTLKGKTPGERRKGLHLVSIFRSPQGYFTYLGFIFGHKSVFE